MSASDIVAGGAAVRVSVEDSGVATGLARVQEKLQSFANNMSMVGAGFAAVGGGIDAYFTKAVHDGVEYASMLNDMSARTGMSTEFLATMKYAAEQSGAGLGAVIVAARTLANQLDTASQGGKGAATSFSRLGLSIKELQGMSPEQQFMAVSNALGKISDTGTRAALAQDIFGRAAQQLLPILGDAAKMEGYASEARRLGIALTSEEVSRLDDLGDMWTTVKAAHQGLANTISTALAPSLIQVQTIVANAIIKVREFVGTHQELIPLVAGAAAGLVGIGAAFVAAGVGAMWLNSIMQLTTTIIPLMSKAFSLALGPAGLVGIIALAAVSVLDGFGVINLGIWDTVEQFKVAGKSIGDWLGMGWLTAEIGFYKMKENVLLAMESLVQSFADAINSIVDIYNSAMQELGKPEWQIGRVESDKYYANAAAEAKKAAETAQAAYDKLANGTEAGSGDNGRAGFLDNFMASLESLWGDLNQPFGDFGKIMRELTKPLGEGGNIEPIKMNSETAKAYGQFGGLGFATSQAGASYEIQAKQLQAMEKIQVSSETIAKNTEAFGKLVLGYQE